VLESSLQNVAASRSVNNVIVTKSYCSGIIVLYASCTKRNISSLVVFSNAGYASLVYRARSAMLVFCLPAIAIA